MQDQLIIKELYDCLRGIEKKLDNVENKQISLEEQFKQFNLSIDYLNQIIWKSQETTTVVDRVLRNQLEAEKLNKEVIRLEAEIEKTRNLTIGFWLALFTALAGFIFLEFLPAKKPVIESANHTLAQASTDKYSQ